MDTVAFVLATAAATTLVNAMTEDGWEQAKRSIIAIWRGHDNAAGELMAADLDHTRAQLLAAQADQRAQIAADLQEHWRHAFQAELGSDRHARQRLEKLVDSLQHRRAGHLVRGSVTHSGSGDNVVAETVTIHKGGTRSNEDGMR